MARAKRTSDVLEELKQKLSGMVTIDPKLDLGNGITVEKAETLVTTGDSSLKEYNTLLSVIDEKLDAIEKLEKEMEVFCSKLLSSASVKYGRDSIEYEKVGGKRTSDIKRAPRKKKADSSSDKK